MKIQVFQSYEDLSRSAAEELVNTIQAKPNAVLSVASGHSPLRTCQIFVELVKQKKLSLAETNFVGLDEWVDISADDPGSCYSFFRMNILEPLSLKKTNYHLFDSSSDDLDGECIKMDQLINDLGGIDLMIVGIGMNGHIGFNEPGVSFDLKSHVIELDNTTQEVGQKYFSEQKVLKKGITLGLSHLMQSRKSILLANGGKKASIVAKAFNEPVSGQVPASILQRHPNSLIFLDQEAALHLTGEKELINSRD